MTGCPFCEYAGPSEILADHGHTIVFAPLDPVTPGHLLVVPRRHVEDFSTDPDESGRVAAVAALHARNLRPCNVITSLGREATQTVKHLHLHVVPRREGDGLALPWAANSHSESA